MNPFVVNGLPAHVLYVHVVVVLVPLTALALVVCALWPRAARRLGLLLPALGLVTFGSVPLATNAGEWLERRVPSTPLLRRHAELGQGLSPWALGLFLVSAAVTLSVIVGAGAVVDVYRIGDAGARAVWSNTLS
ncbi:hypothetical protein AB0D74_21795 [Streptomyces sp. NPDC048278]|uniref:hypothetical protein n=1 Tax=Streptomyces sp. NPDC048278 TaxID=3155809 RepID=UPI003437E5C8